MPEDLITGRGDDHLELPSREIPGYRVDWMPTRRPRTPPSHAALARRAGPLAEGSYRVLVYEPDSRITTRDFASLAEAARYADDAASETEHGVVLSYVLDTELRVVRAGKHYGS